MNIEHARLLTLDQLRSEYKRYLQSQNIAHLTMQTANTDTFYLWRKESPDTFWNTVTSPNFEEDARLALHRALTANSKGNIEVSINSYVSHLRRFRKFLGTESIEIVPDTKPIRNDDQPKKEKAAKEIIPISSDIIEETHRSVLSDPGYGTDYEII